MTIPHLTIEMHLRDVPIEDIERLLRMLKESGGVYVVIEHPETVAVPAPPDISDPAPLPPHEPPPPITSAPPWWSSLKLTQPKTKIYTARDLVKIYRSAGLNHPPQVSDVARIASIVGTGYDVWAAPLTGSEYICVFNGDAADPPQPGFVLWVSGNDMKATP